MRVPGEIPQEIGRAYVQVLVGSLEQAARNFRRTFEVQNNPEKLMFSAPTGASFSFDVAGIYRDPCRQSEVFLECKGHRDGSKGLEDYKQFLAKAYVTSVHYLNHRDDLFWFLSNVPFGGSIGRALTSYDYIRSVLTGIHTEKLSLILGSAPIDDGHLNSLSERISVGIFTDSMIRIIGISHLVKPGESIWSIVKSLHAGRIPSPLFQPFAEEITDLNGLDHPNKILAGTNLKVPWYGMDWD